MISSDVEGVIQCVCNPFGIKFFFNLSPRVARLRR